MLKKLLIAAALGEIGFGLLLLAVPAFILRLLIAAELSATGAAGRILGACLVSVAVVCWPRSNSPRAYYVMLAWSVLAACSLIVAGVVWSAGVLLWPAVVVHGATALLLWRNRSPGSVS